MFCSFGDVLLSDKLGSFETIQFFRNVHLVWVNYLWEACPGSVTLIVDHLNMT